MANYIPCFLNDEAFHAIATSPIESIDTISGQGIGYFTEQLRTFFTTPARFIDPRVTRRTVHSKLALGGIEVHFDKDAETADTKFYSIIQNAAVGNFYNIIEHAIFSQVYDAEVIANELSATESAFAGYAGAFARSDSTSNVTVNRVSDGYVTITVPHWIEFDFRVVYQNITLVRKFRVWLSQDSFSTLYPITTITDADVFLPMPEADLKTLNWNDEVSAMLATAGQLTSEITAASLVKRYSGITTINVQHVSGASIPFSLGYKGPAPSGVEKLTAIAHKLASDDAALVTEWSQYFPTLFSNNRYYVIPFWDSYLSLNAVNYDVGMVPVSRIAAKIAALYPTVDIATDTKVDLIRIPKCRFPTIVFPDPDNNLLTDPLSAVSGFSNYTGTDSTSDTSFTAQDANARTLCIRLARVVAMQAAGATRDMGQGIDTIQMVAEGPYYFQFKIGDIIFYVLNKASYLAV